RRLLRACRERPGGYTATEKRDELPPPHGAYPKAKDHGTKYSRCWGGSVARIAIKRSPYDHDNAIRQAGRLLEFLAGCRYKSRSMRSRMIGSGSRPRPRPRARAQRKSSAEQSLTRRLIPGPCQKPHRRSSRPRSGRISSAKSLGWFSSGAGGERTNRSAL